MKKIVWSLVLVALVATSLVGAVSAADPTFVYPGDDGATYTVVADDGFFMAWVWLATTKGLVANFLKSFSATYTIYDAAGDPVWELSADEAAALWSSPAQTDPAEWAIKCAKPDHWLAVWSTDTLYLEPGEYTLVTEWSYSKPVNDGWHTCADLASGDPLASPPSLYHPQTGAWTVHLVVQ